MSKFSLPGLAEISQNSSARKNEFQPEYNSSVDLNDLLDEPDLITTDLLCLSHLRWDFVYQRPQHLLSRCAQTRRVFFVEEPIFEPGGTWCMAVSQRPDGVWVVVPHLPQGMAAELVTTMLQTLITEFMADYAIARPILWYYTPMALSFTAHLDAAAVVYDCMDELSAFKGASPALRNYEAQLFQLADVVFTGGHSLYEVKRSQHSNVHAFPSSIEQAHFAQARQALPEPMDQACIPHPRLGFYGVVDERMDLDLIAGVAAVHPDWHIVIVGPVVKIDPASLPDAPNIHYLGGKSYKELPNYLAGWDIAMLPFARNESTRFISPTKTPEYLAAGKPVVSTSIRDVVQSYGELGLVKIADTVSDFVDTVESLLQPELRHSDWLNRVDAFLAHTSWDQTWAEMDALLEQAISAARNSAGTATRH